MIRTAAVGALVIGGALAGSGAALATPSVDVDAPVTVAPVTSVSDVLDVADVADVVLADVL